jgi:hypothetical protein
MAGVGGGGCFVPTKKLVSSIMVCTPVVSIGICFPGSIALLEKCRTLHVQPRPPQSLHTMPRYLDLSLQTS